MTTNVMNNKVYPGMACNATEFFIQNNELKIIQNSKVIPFCEISFATQEILQEAIDRDINVKTALMNMHPTSSIRRLEQFAKCRFGGLDFQADIKEGVLQEGEYWPCPKRGQCEAEGILCKLPSFNNKQLSKQDIQLLQLMATNKKNEVIADDLQVSFGTLHKLKKILYEKLGIQTKQQGVLISMFLNLIQL